MIDLSRMYFIVVDYVVVDVDVVVFVVVVAIVYSVDVVIVVVIVDVVVVNVVVVFNLLNDAPNFLIGSKQDHLFCLPPSHVLADCEASQQLC